MGKRRAKGRVPGTFGKKVRPRLEERNMNRGAGAALASLHREAADRAADGRPLTKLELLEAEQSIVRRAQELYRARVTGFDGELR